MNKLMLKMLTFVVSKIAKRVLKILVIHRETVFDFIEILLNL